VRNNTGNTERFASSAASMAMALKSPNYILGAKRDRMSTRNPTVKVSVV
jgi:hypothetical protein